MTDPQFQSTLPARGATKRAIFKRSALRISIHAPRTGSDLFAFFEVRQFPHFNPRSPHGERQEYKAFVDKFKPFQSTLPARGATCREWSFKKLLSEFQSTLPARGATICFCFFAIASNDFNPRSPHGERLRKVTILSIRIIGFAQKVYHKTVLLRISLAENAVILPKRPRNPVRTSLQKAGGLRFARAIRAARPYSISSPSGA